MADDDPEREDSGNVVSGKTNGSERQSSGSNPRLDRLLVLGLVVGVGVLAVVAATGGDDPRAGRLLVVALTPLNGALVAYGVAHTQEQSDSNGDTASSGED
ncbi:hypothetical protein [Natrarchaeobaculum aegyptiacum]|uniref:Uncharacterized protein n=1 Tax=Natrarchaeobaculum aegyptiacum TaxID=745377 RepID=A0A2Z2HY42_9EURY|nr:hypothetical protein [Natrarchaeobaculum aegyptiacum]ARS88408.1 hypothetical protein B1756_00655 [Natrarchaeobaculum aegyptiacum]